MPLMVMALLLSFSQVSKSFDGKLNVLGEFECNAATCTLGNENSAVSTMAT